MRSTACCHQLRAMEETKHATPSMLQAVTPVVFLILMLTASVAFFGRDSSQGPNQIVLILSAMVAVMVGMRLGFSWRELQDGMVHGVSLAMGAIFILLVVGSLIGTWIMAGIVPTMIYYGLQILNPQVFLAASCVICALVAVATGSSWTTASTIGIALIGIAAAFELNLGMAAGAVISGAYLATNFPRSQTQRTWPRPWWGQIYSRISATCCGPRSRAFCWR